MTRAKLTVHQAIEIMHARKPAAYKRWIAKIWMLANAFWGRP